MGRFVAEFFPPDTSPGFLRKVAPGTWETLAMSALGTLLAAARRPALALPASRCTRKTGRRWRTRHAAGAQRAARRPRAGVGRAAAHLRRAWGRSPARWRWPCTPPACWAGCLPRRWRTPRRPGDALRTQGAGAARVFLYATLPQVLPQLLSYTLYRWENNIRAAAVLGVVGAGGLGQLLAFHMGLFHMGKTATILGPCWCWWRWWTRSATLAVRLRLGRPGTRGRRAQRQRALRPRRLRPVLVPEQCPRWSASTSSASRTRLAARGRRRGWRGVLSHHEQFGALAAALVAERLGLPGTSPESIVCRAAQAACAAGAAAGGTRGQPDFAGLHAVYGGPVPAAWTTPASSSR
jgi:phosphonate transport system permease protein